MVIFLTSERLSAPAVIDFGLVFEVTNYPPAVTSNPPSVTNNRSSYPISENTHAPNCDQRPRGVTSNRWSAHPRR